MTRVSGSNETEQAQNPMYNLLVNKIPDRFHEYTTLAKVEPLRYPLILQQLQSAFKSYSIFTDECMHLGELADRLGKENPMVLARSEKVANQLTVITTKLDRIGSRYQTRLNEKVVEYSKQMNEQYDVFYRHMVDNLLVNIKEGNVTVPEKGPMDPTHPRNPRIIEGFVGAYNWSKFVVKGTLPSDGFETCQKIMDEYDRLLDEAGKLWEATKDTSLNTQGLYGVLFQHSVMFRDEKGTPHMGGKRGKINIDYQAMKMFADKGGLFDIEGERFSQNPL